MHMDDGSIYDRVKTAFNHYIEAYFTEKAAAPEWQQSVKHDPNFGFDAPRKERVMVATQKEMEASGIALPYRDYCAHHMIEYKKCMNRNTPCYWRCQHLKHTWIQCQQDDYTDRYREYERERRLNKRELTLAGKDFNGNPLPVPTESAHAKF
ncbi:hypothetical protein BV898_04843 [Hypsibius exemplaris]|uniref:NADH dehydrogenase [ubiquinone] 1 beta subcomplex subunit 7 n=1 Tax=Hypsibius exemplaris TaxID=2072580 RepID=A0A1W0X0R6_HYPEX|nr:hypothetical protein BV898_04843 [Hypsibius exemplaris]